MTDVMESKPIVALISLLVTMLMWISFSGRLDGPETVSQQVFTQIPVLHQNVPDDIDVKSAIVLARLTLSGSQEELDAIDPNTDLRVELGIGGLGPGNYSLSLTAGNVTLPQAFDSLKVIDIEPKTVEFTLLPRSTREVALELTTIGQPAPNYEVKSIELTPPVVTLTGPSAETGKHDKLTVEPVDISGAATGTIEGAGRFDFSNQVDASVVISGITSLHYRITIGEVETTKRFRKSFPIQTNENSGYSINPKRANLKVSGPVTMVDWFSSEWVVPEVLLMEFITDGPGGDAPAGGAPAAVPGDRQPASEQAYSVTITERWVLPDLIKDAFPDWADKVSSLRLEWEPAKVEVRRK